MRIDKTHRPWMLATLALLALSLVIYVLFAVRAPSGPRGGSALGLTFGIAGYALMLYAGLLGARKKVPVWRLGRAQTWMRGHIWLGLLSLPLILFHGGFAFRGPLTAVLMWLFFIVIGSGVIGALVQHYVPRMLTSRVPMETIYEEIPHVRAQLREEADQLVSTVCGPVDTQTPAEGAAVSLLVEIEQEDRARFREIYLGKVRPFLSDPDAKQLELADPRRAAEVFESLRRLLVASVHPVLKDLENICEEEHQLSGQIRIYRWLHAWLLVHVPLSIALLVLGAVHAVMALRY
ncbi:MAG TPA: hypothetical protein VGP62_22885 [Bryobacteraceae bacterium]|jgi:hypothetical protein|nr:hypothetical protein [Bryobacteraceae bacterium]